MLASSNLPFATKRRSLFSLHSPPLPSPAMNHQSISWVKCFVCISVSCIFLLNIMYEESNTTSRIRDRIKNNYKIKLEPLDETLLPTGSDSSSFTVDDSEDWCKRLRSSPEPKLLVYNRIPKVSSSAMRRVFREISKLHKKKGPPPGSRLLG